MNGEIEKGVPIPKPRNAYPFNRMEPGDSVTYDYSLAYRATNAAYSFCKRSRPDLKVMRRKEGDKVRIWLAEK